MSDPPAEFDNDNLELPKISYVDEEDVFVTLICEVTILNGIEKWKNVSYLIRWFSKGKSLKNDTICGGLLPGEEHNGPCPDQNLISRLSREDYTIGQWVRISTSFVTNFNQQSGVLFFREDIKGTLKVRLIAG